MLNKGTLFIFSAASGGGKSSLAQALNKRDADIGISVSHTTRDPRPGEINGQHYHFVTVPEFEELVAQHRFLEHARVFDHYYGTSRQAVQLLLDQGKHVILDIDWQGARSIKAKMPEAVSIFILPPSREELERRLRARGQDSEEIIKRRMADAVSEMQHYSEFDHVIVNDDFDAALDDLEAIIHGHPGQIRSLSVNLDDLLRL
ncbi:MAG TPA: guanylate kinase [Acidiferrobacteraceae bacterium]|nr:guanylate kinase [Acidiferrobacteraceae bacterium]HEX19681.1 guanylate kinase [Acidiferrobacteraceae bacterium]